MRTEVSRAIKVCCFDLETTSLDARFGVILCACIKPDGEETIVLRGDKICPNWKKARSDDKALVLEIANELVKYDILCGHNAQNFDIPYIRTRMIRWRLAPTFPDKKVIDPYQLARNRFRLNSNSLRSISDFLGFGTKTDVDGATWLAASLDGCTKAMDRIVEHCIRDVELLENVLGAVKGYSTTFNSRGSGW